jgi:hypothetical protein
LHDNVYYGKIEPYSSYRNINIKKIVRMKHFLHKISLLATAALMTVASYAQNYEYEGLNYILDHDNATASVTYQGTDPEENNYKGEIEIPARFKYEGKYYYVTSIGEKAFYGCDSIA